MPRDNKPAVTGDLTASAPGARVTGLHGAAAAGFTGGKVNGKPGPVASVTRYLSASIQEMFDTLASSATNGAAPPPPSVGIFPANTITSSAGGTVPFTFGQVFTQGVLPSGQLIAGLQTNVLTTWPDGSARFAIVSGTKATTAGVAASVSMAIGSAASGTALGAATMQALGATVTVDAGAFGSAPFSGSDWGSPFETVCAGPVMAQLRYRKQIGSDAHLVAWLECRVYADSRAEIIPHIENGFLNVASPTNKSATYTLTINGSSVFSQAIDLPNHCRTPLISGAALSYWVGTNPGVTVDHEKAYLSATRMVPSYRATVPPSSAPVTSRPSTYTPLQQGDYPTGMGSAGYHGSIGLLPEWDVIYLTSTASSLWSVVQRNAYSAGRYGIHFRDESTNLPLAFSSYTTLCMGGGNAVAATGASSTNSYTPNATGTVPATFYTSHHPSMGFLAYLLTGWKYHLETLQFVATANFLKQGDINRNGSDGIMLSAAGSNTTRGMGWALRTLAQAAAISPDADPIGTQLRTSYAKNAAFNYARYVAQPNNPQGWVQPYSDYTAPVFATTEAGSTSTNIILPAGYVYLTDGIYNGQELVIGGQVRIVSAYVGATRTATVSPAFSVTTASQPFELRTDNVYMEATWMQDFVTAAVGYGLAMQPNIGSTDLGKLEEFFHWKAQSIVGRFGSAGLTEYLYRDAAVYNIAVAPSNQADWITGAGPWYKSWGDLYTDTFAINGSPGARVAGDLRGTSGSLPTDTTGYWANLLPALSYAVEHKAAGAYAAYLGLTTSTAWTTQAAGYDSNPVWGVKPPTEPTVPAWVPASVNTFKNVSLNTLLSVAPTGWPNSDIAGPFINWCGGFMVKDYSGFGAQGVYGSGHLASPTNPLWAGVNLFNWDTLLWSMTNVPAAPTSDSTGYNTYGESTDPVTAGHLTTPHTYDSLSVRPRNAGGGKGALRHRCFPGAPFSNALHEFDLSSASAAPSRKVNALPFGGGAASGYAMATADEARGGDWCMSNNGSSPLCFVSWRTNAVTQFAVGYLDYGDHSLILLPAPWNLLLAGGRGDSGDTIKRWYVCPIVNDAPTGFTEIFPTGTGPTSGQTGGVFSPVRDQIVMYDGALTTRVYFLTPPAPGATPTTGWAFSFVDVSGEGGITPSHPGINTNNQQPYATNGCWSKFQEVRLTSSLSVWGYCSSISGPMQAWRV